MKVIAICSCCVAFVIGALYGSWITRKAWPSKIQEVSWDYFEMGAQRAAIYTLNHGYMPSRAFREIVFELPAYSDEDVEREAKRRYPPIGTRQE